MKDINHNPNYDKDREYNEILKLATDSGHLEGIHTHESHDAREVMEHTPKAPLSVNNNGTPGQDRGVEGTVRNIR